MALRPPSPDWIVGAVMSGRSKASFTTTFNEGAWTLDARASRMA